MYLFILKDMGNIASNLSIIIPMQMLMEEMKMPMEIFVAMMMMKTEMRTCLGT